MQKSNLEFKVGVFVLVSLVVLGWLVFRAGDFSLKPGYTVRFIFGSVGGVESGSPVRLAGVPVGQVKVIQVTRTRGETQVEITAQIEQGVFIEEDAEVHIDTLGLLGEKYIEITPGTGGARTLVDGGVLVGRPPGTFEKMTESGTRLIQKMEHMVDNINGVVADPEFKTALKGTFVNANDVAKNLKEASEDIRDASKSARIVLARLRDGEGTVGKLLKDDKIAKDLEAFVADVKAHPWKLLKRG
jgi:phospholipid/cholesterol/gamma-HCH transport system substrate-binding protein